MIVGNCIMNNISIVILLLFIVVPVIGAMASKMREAAQPPPARPLGQGDSRRIQEQIDEFLRRASQRGAAPAAAPKPPGPAPAAVEVLNDDAVGSGVDQQVKKYLDASEFRRRSEALGGEIAQADEQFTQQVRKTFSGEVGKLSARRGESAAAPEVVEGEIVAAEPAEGSDISRPVLEALPAAGSGLAELLGSADNITHAIIMSEILRRHEW
jgi:hypothetical protein